MVFEEGAAVSTSAERSSAPKLVAAGASGLVGVPKVGADVSVDGACVGATDTFLLTAAPASVVGEVDELLEAGTEGEARAFADAVFSSVCVSDATGVPSRVALAEEATVSAGAGETVGTSVLDG